MINDKNNPGLVINNTANITEPQILDNQVVIDDEPTEILEQKTDTSIDSEELTIVDQKTQETVISSRKQQSVIQESDINNKQPSNTSEVYTLPADFDKETKEKLLQLPNIELVDNDETRQWATDVSEGLTVTTFKEIFTPTLEDSNADFRQTVTDNGVQLAGGYPALKSIQNQNLKGERAVVRLATHLGLGSLFQVPLWHSGIWVTFKPPGETDLIELNRILISDKIKFGRYSYGLAYSNILSFTVDRLVNFALAHVYDISAKSEDITIENLKQHILSQDIYTLLWGFMCTVYPKGFKYRRACISDPEKCNFVLEETLNLTKLQWTNTAALTDWQKTFMSGRQNKSKDLASINRYKEELGKVKNKRIIINEGLDNEVAFILKSPSIQQYVEAGYRWIGDIVDEVDRALGLNTNDDERNNFITRHGQATAMRQYIHWIQSIEFDSNVIDDLETIEKNIDMLSANDTIRNEFIKGVVDYINESTITVIGIPVFDCPSCKTSQEKEHQYPAHKNIIPLDVIQLFFALLGFKMESLTSR